MIDSVVIAAVSPGRRQLAAVSLDDGETVQLYAPFVDECGLRPGQTIPLTQWEELCEASALRLAREKALRLLALRDHTRAELVRKLRESGFAEAADAAADGMEALGYLDDARFAANFAEELNARGKYGVRRIGSELMKRGVPRDLAEDAVAALENDPISQISKLLERQYAGRLDTVSGREKAAASLARAGFAFADIRTAMKTLGEGSSDLQNQDED